MKAVKIALIVVLVGYTLLTLIVYQAQRHLMFAPSAGYVAPNELHLATRARSSRPDVARNVLPGSSAPHRCASLAMNVLRTFALLSRTGHISSKETDSNGTSVSGISSPPSQAPPSDDATLRMCGLAEVDDLARILDPGAIGSLELRDRSAA